MLNFKDGELTEEELKTVKAGIEQGKIDETLDLMDKPELSQLKEKISDKELTFDEMDRVKAGMPSDVVDKYTEDNKDIFRKM